MTHRKTLLSPKETFTLPVNIRYVISEIFLKVCITVFAIQMGTLFVIHDVRLWLIILQIFGVEKESVILSIKRVESNLCYCDAPRDFSVFNLLSILQ